MLSYPAMRNASAGPQLKKENDVLTSTRKDFGKLDRKPIPLDDRLYLLSEQELYLVLQTAQFVKMAHDFGERSDEPNIQLVREMYPKVSFNLQNIIVEVLQDAEPLEEQPKKNKRDEIIKGVQDRYAMSGTLVDTADDVPLKMMRRVVELTVEEKAEQLKDKILETLKLND